MKEVVNPQKDASKGERDKIWIPLKEKYMFIIFITNQDFSGNCKINFANTETIIGQCNY